MTTKLRLNDFEAVEKVGIGERFFNMDSTTQIDIPRDRPATFPIPERIIVRTLDVISAAAGPIGWLEADQSHPCHSLADVANMVAAVREGRFDPRPRAAAYHRPLDLNLSRPTCFIIRLSSSWRWRFSHKAKGASLGPNVNTDPTNYCQLRHVLDNGTEQYPQFDHPDECKIIYFFAKPPTGNFNNSFNLNIELMFEGVDVDEINSIPIVIDPDIRFPGGSGD
jgi:hypothetical protein